MRRELYRRLRSAAFGLLFPPVTGLLGLLPWRAVQRMGRWGGRLAWHLSRRARLWALDNIRHAYPDASEGERLRIARASFEHATMNFTECLNLQHRSCQAVEAHVETQGWDRVMELRRAGRPIIILAAHAGNWELLAALINCRGLKMSVVGRQLRDPVLHRHLLKLRRRFGTETLVRGSKGLPRKLAALPDAEHALGLLIDQDTDVPGVWVPFFGRPAYTPLGAARLAHARGAAVVPSFLLRRPDGTHRALFREPLELPADPVEATALMTRAIEHQIRLHPEQWVWFHRRWRRQPPAEPESEPGLAETA